MTKHSTKIPHVNIFKLQNTSKISPKIKTYHLFTPKCAVFFLGEASRCAPGFGSLLFSMATFIACLGQQLAPDGSETWAQQTQIWANWGTKKIWMAHPSYGHMDRHYIYISIQIIIYQ